MKKQHLLIGAQVSIAGGFDKAIIRGTQINARCIQIFTKSNRQWHAKKITKEAIHTFKTAQKKYNLTHIITHACYLINLGSSNDETIQKSIKALVIELQRCEELSIKYLVLHPGSAKFENLKESLIFTAQQLDKVFMLSKTQTVHILLETMAGQGKTIGKTFEELATIIEYSSYKKRIGICFDTCHAFAAGYNFSTLEAYKKMWRHFDNTIGLKKLKTFHINDSKKEFDSHLDRHENIGFGKIPIQAFHLILVDKQFKNIPKILETPKGPDEMTNNIKNIKKLEKLSEK